ncbi:MAG: PilN domain-containing protein [Phycisphaerales bacterium]|nr:PilN domain-containing protein [Phycisphaerales bacterium]
MMRVNLIPPSVLTARARARRVRIWGFTAGVYVSLAASGCLLAFSGDHESVHIEDRLAETTAEIDSLTSAISKLKIDIASSSRQIAAAKEVTAHPDWSTLLSVVADARPLGLVLDDVAIDPVTPKADRSTKSIQPASTRPSTYTVTLRGLAKGPREVTAFVLNLEALTLFASVELRQSSAARTADSDAAAFHIVCTVADQSRSTP